MRGGGSGATLEALPTPLGSTTTLFIPPAFAGPGAIPLIGTFPVAAEPALRANCANEAAEVAKTTKNAKAIFTVVFGMGKLHYDSRGRRMREADVGSQSAGTIKLKFRKAFGAAVRAESVCTEVAEVNYDRGTKGSLGTFTLSLGSICPGEQTRQGTP